MEIRARSGHSSVQTTTLRVFTDYERLLFFIVPFISALIFLAAGAWAVWKRLDDPVARSFALFSASTAFVLGGWFDVWSTHRFVPLWLLAIGIAAGALIRYALLFPSKFKFSRADPIPPWVGFVIGMILSVYAIFALNARNNPFFAHRSLAPAIHFWDPQHSFLCRLHQLPAFLQSFPN